MPSYHNRLLYAYLFASVHMYEATASFFLSPTWYAVQLPQRGVPVAARKNNPPQTKKGQIHRRSQGVNSSAGAATKHVLDDLGSRAYSLEDI